MLNVTYYICYKNNYLISSRLCSWVHAENFKVHQIQILSRQKTRDNKWEKISDRHIQQTAKGTIFDFPKSQKIGPYYLFAGIHIDGTWRQDFFVPLLPDS